MLRYDHMIHRFKQSLTKGGTALLLFMFVFGPALSAKAQTLSEMSDSERAAKLLELQRQVIALQAVLDLIRDKDGLNDGIGDGSKGTLVFSQHDGSYFEYKNNLNFGINTEINRIIVAPSDEGRSTITLHSDTYEQVVFSISPVEPDPDQPRKVDEETKYVANATYYVRDIARDSQSEGPLTYEQLQREFQENTSSEDEELSEAILEFLINNPVYYKVPRPPSGDNYDDKLPAVSEDCYEEEDKDMVIAMMEWALVDYRHKDLDKIVQFRSPMKSTGTRYSKPECVGEFEAFSEQNGS